MPKDFNELLGDDYAFNVREFTFHFRDMSAREFAKIDAILEDRMNGKKEDARTMWDRYAEQIEAFLPEEERASWRSLYDREEQPLTIGQLIGVRNWLLEVQVDRHPTNVPPPSSPGRGRTVTPSTAK